MRCLAICIIVSELGNRRQNDESGTLQRFANGLTFLSLSRSRLSRPAKCTATFLVNVNLAPVPLSTNGRSLKAW